LDQRKPEADAAGFHPEPAHVPHHTDANGRKFLPVARSTQHHAGPTVISALVARARLACVSLVVEIMGNQMRAMHANVYESMQTATWQERQEMMNAMFQSRDEAHRMVQEAAQTLKPHLTPEQQKLAATSLPGLMPFGPGRGMGRGQGMGMGMGRGMGMGPGAGQGMGPGMGPGPGAGSGAGQGPTQ